MHRIAFIGFKHSHIFSLYELARKNPDVTISAACETDPAYRRIAQAQGVHFTHDHPEAIFREASIDIIAIGDAYGLRGAHAIAALKAGKHVLSDKPLCTSMAELDEISRLSAATGCRIGLMLDLRFSSVTTAVGSLLQEGPLGAVRAASFYGQHPLMYGSRPEWYFAEQMHGGTINDIAVHGLDIMACLAGLRLRKVLAARCWNAYAEAVPGFKDCAQFMAVLDNGCGLLADVSYAVPDSLGYSLPFYWRFTLWCAGGVIEFCYGQPEIRLALNGDKTMVMLPVPVTSAGDCLQALLDELHGRPALLDTAAVLRSSQDVLVIQAAADQSGDRI